MNKKIKSIIVDDEWLVRAELKHLLADFPEIEVVDEAGSVPQAKELIEKYHPDVIFLDIQLPGQSGFALLEQTPVQAKIIFITAFDQYAIRAFEVNALDYLLKPIRKERLAKSIQRLSATEGEPSPHGKVTYDDVIYLLVNGSLQFVRIASIKCVIAESNYSFIICQGDKKELVTKSLLEWEQILPEKFFIRIHRSVIVNFSYVEKVKRCRNHTHEVILQGVEKPFTMSRRYAARLKKILPI